MKEKISFTFVLFLLFFIPLQSSAETGVFSGRVNKTFPPLPRQQMINEALKNALLQASQVAGVSKERIQLFVKTSVYSKDKKPLVEDAPDFKLLMPISLVNSYQIGSENSEQISLEVKIDLTKFKTMMDEKWETYQRLSSGGIDGTQKDTVSLLLVRDSERMINSSAFKIPDAFPEFTKVVKDAFEKRRISLITLPSFVDKNAILATTRGQRSSDLSVATSSLKQMSVEEKSQDIPELVFLVSYGFEMKFDEERLEQRYKGVLLISSISTEKNTLLKQTRFSGDWLAVRSEAGFQRLLMNAWSRQERKLSSYLRDVRTELYSLRKGRREILFEVDRVFSYRYLNNLKEALNSQVSVGSKRDSQSVILYGMGQGRVAFNIRTHLSTKELADKIASLSTAGIPIEVYEFTPNVVRGRLLMGREQK